MKMTEHERKLQKRIVSSPMRQTVDASKLSRSTKQTLQDTHGTSGADASLGDTGDSTRQMQGQKNENI